LTEAGLTDRDGDGIRERAGSRFMFTVTVPIDALEAREAAVYLQQAFRSVGVAMEIETLEFRVVAERLKTGDVEALVWITGPGADNHLERFGTGSPIGIVNPRLSSLLEAAREAMDRRVEDSLYRLASEVFEQEMPATWLYPKVDVNVTRANVRGYDETQGDLFMNLGRVWMEKP
jgi:ABC-type transport system substrate-binding protein